MTLDESLSWEDLRNKSGIYVITSKVSKDRYIGSSKNFRTRFNGHLNQLKLNKHCNVNLSYYFNNYENDLVFSIVEYIDLLNYEDIKEKKKVLLDREQYYFDTTKPEMNILKFAYSTMGFCRPHTELTKQKISNGNKGKKLSEETKEKLRNVVVSKETRIKMSIKRKDRITTDETRIKQSKSQKGRKHSEETKNKMSTWQKKLIYQLDLNNEIIKMFDSIKDVSIELNIDTSSITKCCQHKRISAGGFKFEYVNNVESGCDKTNRANKINNKNESR